MEVALALRIAPPWLWMAFRSGGRWIGVNHTAPIVISVPILVRFQYIDGQTTITHWCAACDYEWCYQGDDASGIVETAFRERSVLRR
jgi:hypothetical protein